MKEEAQIEQKYVNIRKVNILGITGSGKSTLVSLLQESEYQSLNPENPEDNVDMIKQVLKANITFKNGTSHFLNIVVASLDEMSVSTKTLLYDTDLIILIIDITSMESFIRIKAFLESLTDTKDYKIILVTNKIDLDSNREISGFEIKQFKDDHPTIREVEVSLKTKENYNDLLQVINEMLTDDEEYNPFQMLYFQEPPSIVSNQGNSNTIYKPLKLFLLGNSTVGKTSFIKKFFKNEFGGTITTLGVDVEKTLVTINDTIYKIEVWDTAGQERLRSIPRQYYSKGDGFILMFDVTSEKSFNDVVEWVKDIRGNGRTTVKDDVNSIVILLVGNKVDCVDKRVVTTETAEQLAEENNLKYVEISCKSGLNIQETMARLIMEAYRVLNKESDSFMLIKPKKKKGERRAGCCQD